MEDNKNTENTFQPIDNWHMNEESKDWDVTFTTNYLNDRLQKISLFLKECADLELLKLNIASVRAIYDEVATTLNQKTYNVSEAERPIREFISNIIQDSDTSIQQVALAIDAIEFWNSDINEISRQIFDYSNKCLISYKYRGIEECQSAKRVLQQLNDANITFTKDALYQDFLTKAIQLITKRIEEVQAQPADAINNAPKNIYGK